MVYLFDIDGVIIHYVDYFSNTMDKNKYVEPTKAMDDYYQSPINCECDKGKRDIYKEIKPYLEKIKWDSNSEEYFKFQWNYEKDYIEKEIIKSIKNIKIWW